MDAEIGSPSSSISPRRRRSRFTCRRIDKLFCLVANYFPLFFVYGVSTWALYTEAYSISYHTVGGNRGLFMASLGVMLYVLQMWAYTFAVFTSPGTPMDNKHAYSHLPTSENSMLAAAVTVKSDGQERFCKKCQCRKPDRTHHCSSCRTCVLKMDHHCPWLANCLGLHNYKAFLLFLIYTSLYCILCFAASCKLVYTELFDAASGTRGQLDDFAPVNWVLLAVISGIIGLVLSGFTTWHLILTSNNMTTIESLEKVRYTAPALRTGAAPAGAQLLDDYSSPHHEYNRYGNYLLEESNKKLPHAFNLGTKRNFAQVFGGRTKMWLWPFPMFTGVGDGWNWETSKEWQEAALALKAERDKWMREQGERERLAGWGYDPEEESYWNRGNQQGLIQYAGGQKVASKADRLLGRSPGGYTDTKGVPMKKMRKKPSSVHAISDNDEDYDGAKEIKEPQGGKDTTGDAEWGAWGD